MKTKIIQRFFRSILLFALISPFIAGAFTSCKKEEKKDNTGLLLLLAGILGQNNQTAAPKLVSIPSGVAK